MADDISFLLQSVHDIISNIDRLINESNNQMDFELVLDKFDYVQRIVVSLHVEFHNRNDWTSIPFVVRK